jgi:hypothetical protein
VNPMTASTEDASELLEPEAALELTEDESPPATPLTTSTPVIKHKRSSTLERRSRKSSSPSPMSRRDELLKIEFDKLESEKPDSINFDQVKCTVFPAESYF